MIPIGPGPFITLTEGEIWAIIAVFAMMLFDVIVGVVCALIRHDFKSSKMREGLGHKALLILMVCLAFFVQGFALHVADLGFDVPLIVPVCVYITLMEIASVLETIKDTNPELADTPIFKLFEKREEA